MIIEPIKFFHSSSSLNFLAGKNSCPLKAPDIKVRQLGKN
jgi:hypothetical protein